MNNRFSKEYTFFKLIGFALPNIIMQIFMSLYTIVDGIFIARFAGSIALGSINIIFPLISVEMAISIMLAIGGSAIVAYKLGAGEQETALENFSLISLITLFIGIAAGIIGFVFMPNIVRFLGASELQFDLCVQYGTIVSIFSPAFFLQMLFQVFFITAAKPEIGLGLTMAAGFTNMLLDYIFIKVFGWGLSGAALATGMGACIPAVIGTIYFLFNRKGTIYFVKPKLDIKMLLKSCANGSSEMVTNLANAVTTFLFNYFFMRFYGEDGVASISIVMYFMFIFSAIDFGYATAISPIISFKQGSNDTKQLRAVIRSGFVFILITSIGMFILSITTISSALQIFAEPDSAVYAITHKGFPIFAISFLFMGINIFTSSMFTALSNGFVSAVISFGRTLIFLVAALVVLPFFLGSLGVWLAVPAAEILGLIVCFICLIKNQRRYGY